MNSRRFELVDDESAKFWEIVQEGAEYTVCFGEYTVCFGKIGVMGQAKTKILASQDAAILEVSKLIKEKTGKGYVEVGESLSAQLVVETGMPLTGKDLSSPTTKSTKFNGLISLSDAAVEALSKRKDLPRLDGLTSLSDAAAVSLSKHKGELNLNGLTSLSDAAAEALSKHKNRLFLDGLISLSDAAAKGLSKHKGELSLIGLENISDITFDVLTGSKHIRLSWDIKKNRFVDELMELRNAGATSILIYYRGSNDGGCFERDAFKGCNKMSNEVSKNLAEFLIEISELNDLYGMADGAIGIIHVDLSTGNVYKQAAMCYVSIQARVEEFLGLCYWAKCKSVKAKIKLCVDDNSIEVKGIAKVIPVSAYDFVEERLQSLFGFIQNNEFYEEESLSDTEDSSLCDILLSHCGDEGDEFDLEIDINEGRFKFSGIKGYFECSFPHDSETSLGCLQPEFTFDLPKPTK